MNTTTSQTALVVGITGGAGYAIAEALSRHGFAIRALVRDPAPAQAKLARRGWTGEPIDWRHGDALRPDALRTAAEGCTVIVHGVNPPMYRRWRQDGIPMLAASISAARSSGARLVFPGNVYVFNPSQSLVDEATPHAPRTVKGAIRVEMEAMLRGADIRSLTVRAGDFFGPGAENSWLGIMAPPGARVVRDPSTVGVGHAWAYLPDFGEAVARSLACEDRLAPHAVFHFGGHWIDPGHAMADALADAIGARVKPFPWPLMWLLAPFVPVIRRGLEMRWLWRYPVRLDNRRLVALIGPEPHTPLPAALRLTRA